MKDCPQECDTSFYQSNVFTSRYPTSYYAGVLSSQDKIKKKFVPSHTFVPDKLGNRPPPTTVKVPVAVTTVAVPIAVTTVAVPGPTLAGAPATTASQNKNAGGGSGVGVRPPPSRDDITNSFARINIHLDSTDYTLIEESPAITSDMLIGVVGKAMLTLYLLP